MSPLNPALAPQRREHLDAGAMATLVACCVLWGFAQVAGKVALADFPPLTQAALRSAGAALLLLGWSLWRGVSLNVRDGTLAGGLLAGALFAAEFACIFIGLQYTTASRMAVFIYLAPFVVALGMPFITRGERLSTPQWAGLVVAFAGVALAFSEGFLASSGAPAGDKQWLGDALGVASAVLWGATTLAIRATRLASAPAEKTLLYQLVVSALLLALGALLARENWPQRIHAMPLAALLFQTVAVTFVSYLAWFSLIARYPATKLASFTLLTPVAGLAFGVLLLNEPLTWRLLIALAAVVTGPVLVNRR